MARPLTWILAAVLLAAPVLAAQAERQEEARRDRQTRESRQDSNRWKWWINPEHRQELGITDEQSRQIDAIFESMFPPQRAKYREAEKIESELSKVMKDYSADAETLRAQVERMEQLHAERRALRTIMLYRINQLLTPEQRVKLDAFNKRREASRRRSDRTDHRH